MALTSSTSRGSLQSHGAIVWRPTKIMHMRDLSKDDDFLSHLLVEKLGTGTVPLLVHKMDSSRRLPKTDTEDLMKIVRRLVGTKGPVQQVIRQAVDELLILPAIRYYLKSYTQKQINAFATHASRYFELYHPSGCIEIAHTSRYSHHTGKSELCILATRNLAPGSVVTELKGSMANLTEEEDKELKRTDLRHSDIRRDFSVIHSKSMKKNHLFLGPARFVNHDCDNNCELFREGRYITFRVLRPIAIGEEITAHYGDGYFGKKNKHCLCETCEKNGRGGYAPNRDDPESSDSGSSSDSDSDSDSDSSSSSSSESDVEKPALNLNERRTRRGVYAVAKPDEDSSDESDIDDEGTLPLAVDAPAGGEIELTREIDTGSGLTSLAPSMAPSDAASPAKLPTPDLMTPNRGRHSSRSLSSLTELTASTPKSHDSTPFRSIISTRRQKTQGSASSKSMTPANEISRSISIEAPRRLTRSASSLRLSEQVKGKSKATPTPIPTPASGKRSKGTPKDEMKVKKEDAEARVLRARPSAVVPEVIKEPPPKPDVPRGSDGKPLPQCSTCSNVLPLIAVDQKVVWGLSADTGKKKKNFKQECPRCIRHFAIYGQPWPRRIPPYGTISVTPREESTPAESITKKVTSQGLSMLDRKLAAAAASTATSKKGKKRLLAEEEEEEQAEEQPPAKRRKSLPEPMIHRPRVTKTYSTSAVRRRRASPVPELPKKRGRPRLSSPRYRPKVKVEDSSLLVEKPALEQPRAINGRFGRKDKSQSKDNDDDEAAKPTRTSPRNKRTSDDVEDLDESPRKKSSKRATEKEVETAAPSQKFLPHPTSGFRGGGLVSNPNPLKYARHAWSAGSLASSSSSSSEDEKHPDTPQDDHSATADIVDPEDLASFISVPPVLVRVPLAYGPSPLNFAKSRWNAPVIVKTVLAQKVTVPRALNIAYASDGEVSDVTTHEHDIVHSPPADDYPSDDESIPIKLQHTYPMLPPTATPIPCIPKGTKFHSANSETKPSFINAGWDDTSDASES